MRMKFKLGVALLAVAFPASQASAERIFGLTTGNTIVTFDSSTPGVTTTSGAIAGLGGDTLTGLDLRPATGTLYSVGTSGTVYAINKDASGRGYTAVSQGVATTPTGAAFGLDFNPVPDRIRLISNTDQNLRINPTTGATIVDTVITSNIGNVDIIGAAYTNSRPGATATVLYAFDALNDTLLRSTNPNGGVYTNTNLAGATFGAFGFDIPVTSNFGFDISGGTGSAFANLDNVFGSVNLTTGVGTIIGNIGAGNLVDITAASVPEPASWALMIGGFGLVGAAMRRRVATVATVVTA
ncbi:DUF4394 domain-containing protein [Glacieibacterium frigidum]|uniref:DUF4394 domain-containing protein n=1 Tax=Glacieibacterium frigidum TaxID=2593303 RepID=A0A552UAV3_9SPHN|nr:DUF4394 domain-containing protein [Glacieibacterium frigidum]TRW15344.1 DUF4394 domain-containing protein [Glacieibacterium frigidum]